MRRLRLNLRLLRKIAGSYFRGASSIIAEKSPPLDVGDNIRLSGGYDSEPAWLGTKTAVFGSVTRFIPGEGSQPDAEVMLTEPLPVDNVAGGIAILKLRYVGAKWESTGTVHVELCDFEPDPKPWPSRHQGLWVESHATYRKLSGPKIHSSPK